MLCDGFRCICGMEWNWFFEGGLRGVLHYIVDGFEELWGFWMIILWSGGYIF